MSVSSQKLLSKHTFDLRWVDIDWYGHMNNAKYYDFMSECRARDFFPFATECGYVVVENCCKYKIPVNYPSSLVVEHYLATLGNSSFELVYRFLSLNGEIHAEGNAKMVCLDLQKNKPIRIPEKLRHHFTAL